MGHVYRHIVMSPDGFIAAPGDNLSWVFELVDADAAIEAGRLDEVVVEVAPVLLGDGVQLFEGQGARRRGSGPPRPSTRGR